MTQSILTSTKKLLGIDESLEVFDLDILIHINSVFSDLHQLGVGPEDPFSIEDEVDTWGMFIGDSQMINSVKSYVYLRVRLLFDPPQTGPTAAAMEKQAEQLAWRLMVASESEKSNA